MRTSAMLAQVSRTFKVAYLKGSTMTTSLSDPERDQAARTVALFTVLIHAWQTNDFHQAASARDELERLGIKVQMPRRKRTRKVDDHAK